MSGLEEHLGPQNPPPNPFSNKSDVVPSLVSKAATLHCTLCTTVLCPPSKRAASTSCRCKPQFSWLVPLTDARPRPNVGPAPQPSYYVLAQKLLHPSLGPGHDTAVARLPGRQADVPRPGTMPKSVSIQQPETRTQCRVQGHPNAWQCPNPSAWREECLEAWSCSKSCKCRNAWNLLSRLAHRLNQS